MLAAVLIAGILKESWGKREVTCKFSTPETNKECNKLKANLPPSWWTGGHLSSFTWWDTVPCHDWTEMIALATHTRYHTCDVTTRVGITCTRVGKKNVEEKPCFSLSRSDWITTRWQRNSYHLRNISIKSLHQHSAERNKWKLGLFREMSFYFLLRSPVPLKPYSQSTCGSNI